MNRHELEALKKWFSEYSNSFYSDDDEAQKNILLKVEHTGQVCAIIARLAADRFLPQEKVLLAEAVGLFHDVGRFPQYARYKTFRDSISVNHGKLGAEVLEEQNVLGMLSSEEQEIILEAVRFHNSFMAPMMAEPEKSFFLRLVRDADKLDIWRVFLEYYENDEKERPSEVNLGLSDGPEYSADILECVLKGRSASLTSMKTQNDFKLLQLTWVYDLNFISSLKLLKEKNYINRIISLLPRNDEIARMSQILGEYMEKRLTVNREAG